MKTPAAGTSMGTAERMLRVVAWFIALLAVTLWSEIVGSTWCIWLTRPGSPARVRRSNWLIRWWGCTLFELVVKWLGARLHLEGSVPPGRYVVISNHQSTADIAIMIHLLEPLNCKFVAKRELGWGMPAVSLALAKAGSALISRHASRRDIAKLRRMAENLEMWDGSAILFAEGRRSLDGHVLPYHLAAIRVVAQAARLPLLPVALDGTHLASSLPRFIRYMPGARVAAWIGEPVPVEAWDGRLEEAVRDIRTWAVARIEEGRRSGLVEPPPAWRAGLADADAEPEGTEA